MLLILLLQHCIIFAKGIWKSGCQFIKVSSHIHAAVLCNDYNFFVLQFFFSVSRFTFPINWTRMCFVLFLPYSVFLFSLLLLFLFIIIFSCKVMNSLCMHPSLTLWKKMRWCWCKTQAQKRKKINNYIAETR